MLRHKVTLSQIPCACFPFRDLGTSDEASGNVAYISVFALWFAQRFPNPCIFRKVAADWKFLQKLHAVMICLTESVRDM